MRMQNRKFEKGGNAPPRKRFQKRKRHSRKDFFIPGCPSGVKIPDNSPEALEKGLKYLKRQMKDVDTMGIYRSKQEFIKPSAKRRKMMKDAVRKQQLYEKIQKRFWDNFTLILPPKKGDKIGPSLPDLSRDRSY